MTIADLAMLDDLDDELRKGRVWECSLIDRGAQVEGLQDGANIYVDPRPAVLEILIHELIHRRHRSWSERRVDCAAKRLVLRMDDATKAQWWRRYQRTKRRGRPVKTSD